jgi:hypothetical protein
MQRHRVKASAIARLLATLLLPIPLASQVVSGVPCVSLPATPINARAEGLTELVGNIVLTATGEPAPSYLVKAFNPGTSSVTGAFTVVISRGGFSAVEPLPEIPPLGIVESTGIAQSPAAIVSVLAPVTTPIVPGLLTGFNVSPAGYNIPAADWGIPVKATLKSNPTSSTLTICSSAPPVPSFTRSTGPLDLFQSGTVNIYNLSNTNQGYKVVARDASGALVIDEPLTVGSGQIETVTIPPSSLPINVSITGSGIYNLNSGVTNVFNPAFLILSPPAGPPTTPGP